MKKKKGILLIIFFAVGLLCFSIFAGNDYPGKVQITNLINNSGNNIKVVFKSNCLKFNLTGSQTLTNQEGIYKLINIADSKSCTSFTSFQLSFENQETSLPCKPTIINYTYDSTTQLWQPQIIRQGPIGITILSRNVAENTNDSPNCWHGNWSINKNNFDLILNNTGNYRFIRQSSDLLKNISIEFSGEYGYAFFRNTIDLKAYHPAKYTFSSSYYFDESFTKPWDGSNQNYLNPFDDMDMPVVGPYSEIITLYRPINSNTHLVKYLSYTILYHTGGSSRYPLITNFKYYSIFGVRQDPIYDTSAIDFKLKDTPLF